MERLKNVIALSIAGATLTLAGCASIVGESQYPVTVNSSPDGAKYEVRNKNGMLVHSGTTPSNVTLKSSAGYFKGETYTITFTKPGHADQTVSLESGVSGWYWGNLLFGGLIGMLIIDPATGSMYKLPESVSGELQQQTAGEAGPKDLTLLTIDQLNAAQRSQLIRVN